jgi:hypothetical protein
MAKATIHDTDDPKATDSNENVINGPVLLTAPPPPPLGVANQPCVIDHIPVANRDVGIIGTPFLVDFPHLGCCVGQVGKADELR